MKYFLTTIMMASSLCACATTQTPLMGEPTSIATMTSVTLPHREMFDFKSSKTGRVYRIYVDTPQNPAGQEGYPIVYTLDANIMFGTVAESVRAMERRREGSVLVVGIGYPDTMDRRKERTLDLTPAIATTHEMEIGGAEDFLHFIQQDLKPEITRRYDIDTRSETLFGHSFGGLFTLYTLINAPESFDIYAAASPSLWWKEGMMMRSNVRGRLGPKLVVGQVTPRVLITVGEYEQIPDPDFPQTRPNYAADLAKRKQVDNAREFAEYLNKQDGIHAEFRLFAGEDHGTVVPGAISRMTRFVLSAIPEMPSSATLLPIRKSVGGVEVPDAQAYILMSPQERYTLRMRVRKLSSSFAEDWSNQLKFNLDAGLSYMQHRTLHEEKIAMDIKYGTTPKSE